MRLAVLAVFGLLVLALIGVSVVALLPVKPDSVTIEEDVPASRLPQN